MRFINANLHHIRHEYRGGGNILSKEQLNFEKDNEYYTPKRVVEYFGKFDYDPATTKEKAKEFGLTEYDTIETDGLKQDWSKHKRIWINPPFTDKHKFLEKAYKTYLLNPLIDIYLLFPIEFLTTKRFHNATREVGGANFIYQVEEYHLRVD